MKITINGTPREVVSPDVETLVSELGLPLAAALVELNGTALLRSEWRDKKLFAGDRVEVIRMVAGG